MQKRVPNAEYLSVKDVAEITGLSIRTIQDRCTKGYYNVRRTPSWGGKNGQQYEILISSLSEKLQSKIFSCINGHSSNGSDGRNLLSNLCTAEAPFSLVNSPDYSSSGFTTHFAAGFPLKNNVIDDAKNIALARFNIIQYWNDYRKNKSDKKQADKEFLSGFNSGIISESLLKKTGKISRTSLFRWNKILKNANNNYIALINNYNYTSELEVRTTLTDSEKQEFVQIYYNDSKFHFETAYKMLKYIKEKRGETIKSASTYRRFINDIERLHYDFSVLSREGSKALNDKVGMILHRDISDIKPGDVLVADGNKLDFTVINPFTGKPVRAVLVVYLDWASFDVAGYEIMLSENTQCIASALRNSILRLGKFPKKVYMDNGKAFRGQFFEGTKSFNDVNFRGIYTNLGIELMIANAYSGRSKVVERFFRNFVQSCPPAVPSYIGNNIENRPAHLKRNEEFQKNLHQNDKIPTIEQAKKIIEAWLEYYRSTPCPHAQNKTVGEVFNEGKGSGVNEELLNELMMASITRTVKRGEIQFFGFVYQSTQLYGKSGKVQVKYSIFDLSKIKVYTLRGEYICDAETVKLVKAIARDGSTVDLYNYKMQLKRNKNLIKQTREKTKLLIGNNYKPFEGLEWSEIQSIPENVPKQKPKLEITLYENLFNTPKCRLRY